MTNNDLHLALCEALNLPQDAPANRVLDAVKTKIGTLRLVDSARAQYLSQRDDNQREINSLRKSLETSEHGLVSVSKDHAALRKERDELLVELESHRNDVTEFGKALSEYTAKIMSLENDRKDLIEKLDAAERTVELQKHDLETLRKLATSTPCYVLDGEIVPAAILYQDDEVALLRTDDRDFTSAPDAIVYSTETAYRAQELLKTVGLSGSVLNRASDALGALVASGSVQLCEGEAVEQPEYVAPLPGKFNCPCEVRPVRSAEDSVASHKFEQYNAYIVPTTGRAEFHGILYPTTEDADHE